MRESEWTTAESEEGQAKVGKWNEFKDADQIQTITSLAVTINLLDLKFASERSFTELIEPTQVLLVALGCAWN